MNSAHRPVGSAGTPDKLNGAGGESPATWQQGSSDDKVLPETELSAAVTSYVTDDDLARDKNNEADATSAAPPPAAGGGAAAADGDATPGGAGLAEVVVEQPLQYGKGSYWAIVRNFGMLGWTAFGGPTAHIAVFHKYFVTLHAWMSEETFAELLALCQAMPGPASTQMSFAIGILQKGIPGGLLSGMLFQYPGLLIMSLAGFGAAEFLVDPAKWLEGASAGLAAVAIALVAEAALMLGNKLCKDTVTKSCAVAAAAVTFYYQSQWIFPLLIVVGGAVTIVTEHKKPVTGAKQDIEKLGLGPVGGAIAILVWLAILVASLVAKGLTSYHDAQWIHWFASFYTTGSVTYGGGQVVLPILEHSVVQFNETCPSGQGCVKVERNDTWVTEQQFLAGLALAQAMPGPLFNFAAYLGAIIDGFAGIVATWVGLFAPGILLIYGVLPFWGRFRKWRYYQWAMPGFNSTAVSLSSPFLHSIVIGLIYASVFTMGLQAYRSSPFPTASISIGFLGFWATSFLKIPAPVAVLGGGVLGVVAWATDMH